MLKSLPYLRMARSQVRHRERRLLLAKIRKPGLFAIRLLSEVWKDVSKVTLSEQKITLLLSDKLEQREQTLSVTIAPETAHYETIVWETSNENIATVDENGKIMGIAAGTCKITASVQGKQVKKASCSVTVQQAVKSLTFNSNNHELAKGSSRKLEITIKPEDASNKKLLWESSDTTIATVSANGTVSGKKCGRCIITATAADGSGVQVTFDVTVVQAVTKIKVDKSSIYLFQGQAGRISYTLSPADATNQNIQSRSNNSWIAGSSVNSEKKYVAITAGQESGETEIVLFPAGEGKASAKIKVYVESQEAIEATGYANWGISYGYPWFSGEYKNTSNTRTIDGITVEYYATNVYGEKMSGYSSRDYYYEEIVNIKIPPKSKKYYSKITAYQFEGAKRIYHGVSRVHFTDGTSCEITPKYWYVEY